MKKSLFAACCIAVLGVSGCGENSDCNDSACSSGDRAQLRAQSQALKTRDFGVTGGSPWGDAPAFQYPKADSKTANLYYVGKAFAVGMINGDYSPDLAYSAYSNTKTKAPGIVNIQWSANLETTDPKTPQEFTFEQTGEGEADSLGYALAVGKFCPNLSPYGVVVASAPTANGGDGAFVIGHSAKVGKILNKQKSIANTRMTIDSASAYYLAGANLAVADVDGDGSNDLIYTVYDWGNSTGSARVLFDFCSQSSTESAVLIDSKERTLYGMSALYVEDLNGDGTQEIIVVDPTYSTGEVKDVSEGAVYFYKYDGMKFVQSRDPLVGEIVGREGGGQTGAHISSLAFVDLDGDGKLDLIVGEPYANAGAGNYAGRVRTYSNTGTGFKTDDPLWLYDSGKGNANFGQEVKVADLNGDGVPDLAVGAPGKKNAQQAYVYVFMGTKDGTVFSKEPYWTYKSDVATANNDSFGAKIEIADLDSGKGWLDLVVGAPTFVDASGNATGRIDVFTNSVAPCYMVDKCLVGGVCYAKDEVSPDSKCKVCDPSRDNFGFSDVTCEAVAETDCTEAGATCDDASGCRVSFKPDGKSCGAGTVCSGDSTVSVYACASGKCEATATACSAGLYCKADAATNAASCKPECESDADCKDATKPVCKTDSATNVASCKPICESNADCKDATKPVCKVDSATNIAACKPICESDADCKDARYPVCKVDSATKIASCKPICESDADCPTGLYCKVDEKTKVASCKAECNTDADCPTGLLCKVDSATKIAACKAECDTDADCIDATKSVCKVDATTNIAACKPICESDADCIDAATPVCKVDATTNIAACKPICESDADCSAGLYCIIDAATNIAACKESVTLTSPSAGETVKNYAVFEGTAPAGAEVSVRNVADDSVICSAQSNSSQVWSCASGLLEAKAYAVYAHVSDVIKSETATFAAVRTAPVITSPAAGEETSVIPTISGTIDQIEGTVSVWQVGETVMERLCIAPITTDGTFKCTAGFELSYGTDYKIRATWTDEVPEFGLSIELASDDVEFSTQAKPREPISILIPAAQSISTTAEVIFSGLAEPYEGVVVYYARTSENGDNADNKDGSVSDNENEGSADADGGAQAPEIAKTTSGTCAARANENGRWACEDRALDNGIYEAYAVDADDDPEDASIRSASVTFTVKAAESSDDSDDGKHIASGGSCSTLPNSQSSAPMWLFAFAGILGMGVIRRRRSE